MITDILPDLQKTYKDISLCNFFGINPLTAVF